MCGIAGEVGFGVPTLGRAFTESACERMIHRGPDETGFHDSRAASLAMCRLKVIGLDGGAQPTYSEDRSVVCVVNGEIYNHRVLRERLAREGYRVGGASDVHVVPALYLLLGMDFVHELEGMFAIALYDTRTDKLHLVTDRVGKKPIFYSVLPHGEVVFASELTALTAHPGVDRRTDPAAIDQYLSYRVVPAPHTIYQGVRKVTPATVLTFGQDAPVESRRYWKFGFGAEPVDVDPARAADSVDELLTTAVRDRLESEVPLGAMLSGGLDSSLVVAMATKLLGKRIHTFSVGFDEAAFDESEHARAVAEHCGTDHHTYRITPRDAATAVDDILWHMGEPFAFPSAIASYHMYRLARRHVTVVLTGDGSDEIFCGYNRYKIFDRFPDVAAADQSKVDLDWLALADDDATRYQSVLIDGVRTGLKAGLYRTTFRESLPQPFPYDYLRDRMASATEVPEPLDRLMQVDSGMWLPDAQLVKIDRMAMAHSVEPRSPMLDHRLIDYVTRLSPALKLVDGNEKAVLKRVAEAYLPHSTVYRRKQELAVPLEVWLGSHLRERIQRTLLAESSLDRGYFDPDQLRILVDDFRPEHTYAIWTLFMLERWHQLFVDRQQSQRELADLGIA